MLNYILRRILISILLLVVATFLCFLLVQSMGDPLADFAAKQRQRNSTNPAAADAGDCRLPTTGPAWTSRSSPGTGHWLTDFVQGDWGTTVNPGRAPKRSSPRSCTRCGSPSGWCWSPRSWPS